MRCLASADKGKLSFPPGSLIDRLRVKPAGPVREAGSGGGGVDGEATACFSVLPDSPAVWLKSHLSVASG